MGALSRRAVQREVADATSVNKRVPPSRPSGAPENTGASRVESGSGARSRRLVKPRRAARTRRRRNSRNVM